MPKKNWLVIWGRGSATGFFYAFRALRSMMMRKRKRRSSDHLKKLVNKYEHSKSHVINPTVGKLQYIFSDLSILQMAPPEPFNRRGSFHPPTPRLASLAALAK